MRPTQTKGTTTDQLIMSKQVDSPKKRQVVHTVKHVSQLQPDQGSNASFNVSYVHEESVKQFRKVDPVDHGALNARTRSKAEKRKHAKMEVRERFEKAAIYKDSKERKQATQADRGSKENNSVTPSVSGMSNVYEGRRVKPMAVIKKFRIYDADESEHNHLELPLSSSRKKGGRNFTKSASHGDVTQSPDFQIY